MAPQPKQEVKQELKQEVKTTIHEGTMDLDAMSPENSGTPTPQPKMQAESQPQADATEAVYHTVAAGENLYRISVKYNTTVDKILKLNNLKNADKIIEGQKIRVR